VIAVIAVIGNSFAEAPMQTGEAAAQSEGLPRIFADERGSGKSRGD